MKVTTRLILVDPDEVSRFELQRILGGLGSLWISEVVPRYDDSPRAAREAVAEIAVVVLHDDPSAGQEAIRQILQANPRLVVVAASNSKDGDTILKAIRAGAQEFLPLPADPDEIRELVDRISPRVETRVEGAKVIAITGAAGGVGCSTLAVNLGVALARRPSCSTALVDFDLLLGVADASLDIIPEHTILDVVQQVDRLDLTLLRRCLSTHASGLQVLACPSRMEDASRIEPDALQRLISLVRQAFSMVVIDTSKGFSATDFVALEAADTILLVVQLDLNCLRNSARLLQLFRQCGDLIDKVRVVANRSGSAAIEIGPKKAEQTLGIPISWQVPNASNVICAARSKGVPLETEAPGCRAHRAIQDIALALAGPIESEKPPPKPRLGRFAAFFS